VRGLPLSTSIHSYVHPISGESFTSVPSTVLKCYQPKPDLTINPPIKLDNTTFLDNVPLSTEFTPDVQQVYATGSTEDIESLIEKAKHGPISLDTSKLEEISKGVSTLAQVGIKLKEALEN